MPITVAYPMCNKKESNPKMAVFDEADLQRPDQLDWKILQNGAISLYFDRKVLHEACTWFRNHGYQLYLFDCTQWKTLENFYKAAKDILNLPEYCGGNLDSFRDCLWSIDIPQESGAVMVFTGLETFYRRWQDFSFELLDILEKQSRDFLLFGRRFIVLIQSNHPNLSFQPVGARPIVLNPEEQEIHLRNLLKKNIKH